MKWPHKFLDEFLWWSLNWRMCKQDLYCVKILPLQFNICCLINLLCKVWKWFDKLLVSCEVLWFKFIGFFETFDLFMYIIFVKSSRKFHVKACLGIVENLFNKVRSMISLIWNCWNISFFMPKYAWDKSGTFFDQVYFWLFFLRFEFFARRVEYVTCIFCLSIFLEFHSGIIAHL